MAENTANKTPDTVKSEAAIKAEVKAVTEPAKPTEAELAAMFAELPEMFRDAVTDINKAIEEHNAKVNSVQAAEAKDPKLIKAEIYEQNPKGNKKLAALLKQELQLQEQIEAIRKQAYEVIDTDGLMPKELSEAEIEKLKAETATGVKSLREKVAALGSMEEMMPMLKGKVLPHVVEIKTRRGAAKAGATKSGEGPKRLRFKRIEINGVTEDGKGNKVFGVVDGEEKYTFTFASAFLRKQHKGINWVPNDLTDAYLKGLDEANLPETHEFVMPYTFKDESGHEQTVNYTVKAYR